ncbi:hypothetical protein [Rhodopila sp.]|uniref:hypothetical protein n=1 Tax=Rhodopila sp. TaxID=2480087 RepID=UPI002BD8673F|nr:hypothetical protein [Rhodopila sp.]HVZ07964.1 hypothetical protein [Rhodopila sp.]
MILQRFLRRTEDGLATLMDLRKVPATPEQTALADRLVDDLAKAGAEDGDASPFWADICQDLSHRARTQDPRYFLRWPPIGATMVHGAAPVTFRMLSLLRRSDAWKTRWAPALRHRQHGHPPPFAPMLSTNAMAIEHAAHLYRFGQRMGCDLFDADWVIEFGGGFGSMCRTIHALGFRGRYVIFDLPPVLALQRYYLGLHGIEASFDASAHIWLCSDLNLIRAALDRTQPPRVSLMSTWAMSEMPLAVRQDIEPFFAWHGTALALLAYQPRFEDNDNRAYFHGLTERTGERWQWTELPVDPSRSRLEPKDSAYLFGAVR